MVLGEKPGAHSNNYCQRRISHSGVRLDLAKSPSECSVTANPVAAPNQSSRRARYSSLPCGHNPAERTTITVSQRRSSLVRYLFPVTFRILHVAMCRMISQSTHVPHVWKSLKLQILLVNASVHVFGSHDHDVFAIFSLKNMAVVQIFNWG